MRITIATVILLAAAVPLAAAEHAATWEAVAAAGKVESRLPETDVWAAVGRGDDVVAESAVRTGRRSRTTLVRGADVVLVDPDSEVVLPASKSGEGRVIQTRGSVLYEVERRERPHFEVVTPYLVAGVKGTTFLVTVEEGYTSVSVEEGLVEVIDPATGERTDVAAGESILRMRDTLRTEHVRDRASDRVPRAVRDRRDDAADKELRRALRDERRRLDRIVDRRDTLIDREVIAVDVGADADPGADVDAVADAGDLDDDGDLGSMAGELRWATGLGESGTVEGIGDITEDLGDDGELEEELEEELVDEDIREGLRPDDIFSGVDPDDPTGGNPNP